MTQFNEKVNYERCKISRLTVTEVTKSHEQRIKHNTTIHIGNIVGHIT